MLARSLALAALVAAAPAVAQTIPETSRSENSAAAINNSLARQSQNRTVQQQNQFEVNSLRNTQPLPPPPVPTPVVPSR